MAAITPPRGWRKRRDRHETPPTLRRTWLLAATAMLTAMLLLGGLALGATQYQHMVFNDTTNQLEDRMSAVGELERLLRGVDEPAAGMMYALGGVEAYQGHIEAYDQQRERVAAAFDEVARVVDDSAEVEALQRTRSSWQELDADVLAAPGMHERNEVFPVLEAGGDPYQETWAHLTVTHEELSELRSLFVAELRAQMVRAERLQGAILPMVLGALSLSLLLLWALARRLRRRVLDPILTLQSAALAMRESSQPHRLELGDCVAELGDLASTLNDTARSLRSSHERLRTQAHTDGLTGLANRKAFVEHLEFRLSQRGAGKLGALFVDLDDFKVVNDTMGHTAGDELLRVVARRLRSALRGDDFAARLGGDEFAIVLHDVDESTAHAVAERMLAALDAPATIQGRTVQVGCSIGVAITELDGAVDSAAELVNHADQAMYTAKKHGKRRIEMFSASLYAKMRTLTVLRHDLAGAADRGEFRLHYQPVLDLASGEVEGLEALLRWYHPVRGLVTPNEFIPLAEETGDIVEIGAWVIDRACQDLAEHLTLGPGRRDPWVSVNVSAKQLTGHGLFDVVKDALERHHLSAHRLVLEVTEAVAVTNTQEAVTTLDELRRHGVTVALDDFGMGFSSLRQLADLPVDVIKIDRSFVSSENVRDHAALNAIVTLGTRLGMRLIAEGIETAADLENLRDLGPLSGQGFLFARPMPVDQALVFLTRSEADVRAGAFPKSSGA